MPGKPFFPACLLVFFLSSLSVISHAQCCAGAGSNPIAGGASTGVLSEHQVEINANYQYVSSRKFLDGHKEANDFLDRFYSNFTYLRLGYGVTKNLTLSVEGGYFFNKTQIGLNKRDTIGSRGFSDLIIFPRYDLINKSTPSKRTELTVGLGLKIPVGPYNDSTLAYENPQTGQRIYVTSPLAVQPTNGSNDFIFYGFYYRGYPMYKLRLFASALYIRKGTNPLGQHFGDYASLGLFAGKTLYKNLGLTVQVKGEYIGQLKSDHHIDLVALYGIDPGATGSKKVLLVPQLSYGMAGYSFFVTSEIPLYQHVNKIQIASQHAITAGVSYSFYPAKFRVASGTYFCPMHLEVTSPKPGTCPKCKMDLELKN